MKSVTFKVTGTGQFPFDMLRYDQCWPARGEDVELISPFRPGPREPRSLNMIGLRCTEGRWASFGWTVTK